MSTLSNKTLRFNLVNKAELDDVLQANDLTLEQYSGNLIGMDPRPDPSDIQPASVDVYMDVRSLKMAKAWTGPYTLHEDEVQYEEVQPKRIHDGKIYVYLQPNVLYTARLREWVYVPRSMVGYIHGVSTVARYGLTPHQQAGLLDPGYHGNPTLELVTTLRVSIEVPEDNPYTRIGQIVFNYLLSPASPGYSGRYQGITEAVGPIIDS